MCISIRQRGVSLIELIMFIVIVSAALAAILAVMNITTRSSADPLVHKQALAIAESLLEEVELMPFTYCDPDDANAASAVAPAGSCASAANEESATIGPEAGETRYSATTPFDNVSDYNGCELNTGTANAACDDTGSQGIRDITGTPTGVTGYAANVAVAGIAFGGIAAADALKITVTVIGPDGVPVTIDGVRTRYAPRAVP